MERRSLLSFIFLVFFYKLYKYSSRSNVLLVFLALFFFRNVDTIPLESQFNVQERVTCFFPPTSKDCGVKRSLSFFREEQKIHAEAPILRCVCLSSRIPPVPHVVLFLTHRSRDFSLHVILRKVLVRPPHVILLHHLHLLIQTVEEIEMDRKGASL
jgi:hypothetical protein